ncbi:MAG: helix-turn-helix transcriptional regulator [bacterium]|nr:helix-turn-helix transcriptional regulator [bacterium]
MHVCVLSRGYTQLEVQQDLGWGRSYISQLLTKQKSLRIDQALMILRVVGVDPGDFWAEVYRFGPFSETRPGRRGPSRRCATPLPPDGDMLADLRRSKRLLEGVVTVLIQKRLITAEDLDEATRRSRQAAS